MESNYLGTERAKTQLLLYSTPSTDSKVHIYFYLCTMRPFTICIMNKQTHSRLTVLLYCSICIAATYFNANVSSSGSYYSFSAKLHKRVHAVLVVF
jgi:hypothetical protein